MADLVLITPRPAVEATAAALLPALALLPHTVSVVQDGASLLGRHRPDLVLVDAVTDLVRARGVLRTVATFDLDRPVLLLVSEGGLSVLDEQWPMDDLVVTGAGPAEVAARVRLALLRGAEATRDDDADEAGTREIRVADVVVDEASWTVRAGGETLNLTFKEFELLSFLAQHQGRVVTRDLLLQEVWGTDYYGGTRTVDVHIRRLRSKLGPEREPLISTIRGVGYRFGGVRGADR